MNATARLKLFLVAVLALLMSALDLPHDGDAAGGARFSRVIPAAEAAPYGHGAAPP